MKCPHCFIAFHDNARRQILSESLTRHAEQATDDEGFWSLACQKCPSCKKMIIETVVRNSTAETRRIVHPPHSSRPPLPPEVPAEYSDDYDEAGRALSVSPKASAALSRRCLQRLIREHFKIQKKDLYQEIGELMPLLPTHLSEAIDSVRMIGNFAAHPLKSTNTGEIHSVEQGEAEWTLETLEQLFDFCFVQPAKLQQRRNALNAKQADIGKPPVR